LFLACICRPHPIRVDTPLKNRSEAIPFDPSRLPFFYGYAVIGFSTVGMLASVPGQTMGVSAFTDYLIRDLGTTRVDLTTAYMIGTIVSSLILTWAGRMYDRFGARLVATAAAVGLGLVLLGLSFSPGITRLVARAPGAAKGGMAAIVVMSFGFFFLRFFGQGLLTMTSRNMLMQWFERRRGLANGISGVFVSFGFSLSPRILDALINQFSWQGAWRVLGGIIGLVFGLFVLVFYRDTPEGCGLKPDGDLGDRKDSASPKADVTHEYTLAEARRVYSFWVFIIALGLLGLYYTAFTFHVASIFEQAGRDRVDAFSVFFPASIISVSVSFLTGWLSDRVKLKYLLMTMLLGMALSLLGLCALSVAWGKWVLVVGNGIAIGHFGLLGGVVWPTFFGRQHLGEISGFNMAAMVFGSAIGPWVFSLSLDATGSYRSSALICLAVVVALFVGAFRANSPQEKACAGQLPSPSP
jgi:MFS transporter, OFA family, oxalate/formate antiporter